MQKPNYKFTINARIYKAVVRTMLNYAAGIKLGARKIVQRQHAQQRPKMSVIQDIQK